MRLAGHVTGDRRTRPLFFMLRREAPVTTVPRDAISRGAPNPVEGGLDDAQFVARVRAGQSEAFGVLVERYSARIYACLFRLVHNREEAEDLAQETFVRAFRFLASFDSARPFRSWLYTIATNVGLNALRSRRRRPPSSSEFSEREDVLRDRYPAPRDDTVCGRAAERELQDRVAAVVHRLSPQSALLVHLHYQEGMSIREAAEIAGISEGAAKVALCRARKSLREWLTGDLE